MRSLRLAAAAALLCTVTACGGAEVPDAPAGPEAPAAASPASPAPPSEAAADNETAVGNVFTDYNRALADQDFATACALSAPETVEALVAGVSQQLGQQATGCEDAFDLIFAVPGAGDLTRQAAESTQVQDVTVDGDTAAVTWSAELQGRALTQTSDLRRVDGRWLLVDTG